jgi:hypothetical protein
MADGFLASSLAVLDLLELPAADTLDVGAGVVLEIVPLAPQIAGFPASPMGCCCVAAGNLVASGPYELTPGALLELGPFALLEILA